jgi:linoleoyl-CoA desaturase
MEIKYGQRSAKEFTAELDEIRRKFLETSTRYGNWKLYVKALMFVLMFLGLYAILAFNLFETVSRIWFIIPLALVIAGIGFNIMHDGSHRSFSSKPWLNDSAGFSLNVLGGSIIIWIKKHVMIHHTHTNVHGHDDDIDIGGVLRLHPEDKHRWFHKYQFIYCWFAYSLGYLAWVTKLDFKKYFDQKVAGRKMIFSKRDRKIFWASKVGYCILAFVIPSFFNSFTDVALGFLLCGLIVGLVISVTFQLAHTVQETLMASIDSVNHDKTEGYIDHENRIHQVLTTANFAVHNPIIRFYTGGLNQQIEHHLFPDISHVHYPKLAPKVKDLCRRYNLPYNENSFFGAIWSHWMHLYNMGKKPIAT